MRDVLDFLNTHLVVWAIPGTTLATAVIILIITLLMRKLFSVWALKYFKKLASRTESRLDDVLIDVLNPPLSFLFLILGFVLVRMVLVAHIPSSIDAMFQPLLQFGFVIVICWLIYRSADVFTDYLEKLSRRTRTELDDILAPYIKKVIKIGAVLLVIFKSAEIFLGMSAAAFFGLLGGMGLTLGLVFKDIIANWFGCGIIYVDNLFREGDWIMLNDGKIIDADVEKIGLRSTTFRNFDKTTSIVPNAMIANGIVKNWSRMYKRRVKLNFKVDGVPADTLELLLKGIRDLLASDEGVHQEFHMVNFREFEGNSRIIRLYYFTKTIVWKEHERVRENINLKLLKLFEQEGVDRLSYTIVDLSDDRPRDFELRNSDSKKLPSERQ
ncbi:mechanosensitive ion channel [candidate division KSB1 bacterium]|nr:mechanosensitive ion channel [candidate division KSB1 bacterium]